MIAISEWTPEGVRKCQGQSIARRKAYVSSQGYDGIL